MSNDKDAPHARPPDLPGPGATQRMLERMIRVDHAGEVGAIRIYEGQLAVLGHTAAGETIRHMAEQEQAHKSTFDRMIAEREVRPTALMPVWNALGYALGAATALMGEKAAMACTVAVEEVIDEHYRAQSKKLATLDPELHKTVEAFRADEIAHRDTALAHGAEQAPGYRLLSSAIKAGCRMAIRLSERV
jgi:ubiquinone biosynthesis monooxygenase Coq7